MYHLKLLGLYSFCRVPSERLVGSPSCQHDPAEASRSQFGNFLPTLKAVDVLKLISSMSHSLASRSVSSYHIVLVVWEASDQLISSVEESKDDLYSYPCLSVWSFRTNKILKINISKSCSLFKLAFS